MKKWGIYLLSAIAMFALTSAMLGQEPGGFETLDNRLCTTGDVYCAIIPPCATYLAPCDHCTLANQRFHMICDENFNRDCKWYGPVFSTLNGCGFIQDAYCEHNIQGALYCQVVHITDDPCGRNYCEQAPN